MWAGSLLRLGQHLFTKRGYLTAKLSSRGSALREIEPNNRNAMFYRRHSPLYDPTGNGNSGGRTKPFPCSVFPPTTCTLSLPEHLTGFKELNSVGACLTPHKYQGLSSIFRAIGKLQRTDTVFNSLYIQGFVFKQNHGISSFVIKGTEVFTHKTEGRKTRLMLRRRPRKAVLTPWPSSSRNPIFLHSLPRRLSPQLVPKER